MTVKIFADAEALAAGAAEYIAASAAEAIAARSQFNIALSGGSTPQAAYAVLAAPPYSTSLDWSLIHVFWSDERCVSTTSIDSNYGAAKRALLDKVAIPAENIHRMKGEMEPDEAAEDYRQKLGAHFNTRGIPVFDLILLGIGEDGHAASLFPRSPALFRGEVPVAENFIAKIESWRLTFTFPLINSARKVAFLVAGENKAEVVREVIEGGEKQLPAKAVNPLNGELTWLLDAGAASKLKSS